MQNAGANKHGIQRVSGLDTLPERRASKSSVKNDAVKNNVSRVDSSIDIKETTELILYFLPEIQGELNKISLEKIFSVFPAEKKPAFIEHLRKVHDTCVCHNGNKHYMMNTPPNDLYQAHYTLVSHLASIGCKANPIERYKEPVLAIFRNFIPVRQKYKADAAESVRDLLFTGANAFLGKGCSQSEKIYTKLAQLEWRMREMDERLANITRRTMQVASGECPIDSDRICMAGGTVNLIHKNIEEITKRFQYIGTSIESPIRMAEDSLEKCLHEANCIYSNIEMHSRFIWDFVYNSEDQSYAKKAATQTDVEEKIHFRGGDLKLMKPAYSLQQTLMEGAQKGISRNAKSRSSL